MQRRKDWVHFKEFTCETTQLNTWIQETSFLERIHEWKQDRDTSWIGTMTIFRLCSSCLPRTAAEAATASQARWLPEHQLDSESCSDLSAEPGPASDAGHWPGLCCLDPVQGASLAFAKAWTAEPPPPPAPALHSRASTSQWSECRAWARCRATVTNSNWTIFLLLRHCWDLNGFGVYKNLITIRIWVWHILFWKSESISKPVPGVDPVSMQGVLTWNITHSKFIYEFTNSYMNYNIKFIYESQIADMNNEYIYIYIYICINYMNLRKRNKLICKCT